MTIQKYATNRESKLAFDAIQLSQIIVLQCEILRGEIFENHGSKSALDLIDLVSENAIKIGFMQHQIQAKN